MDGKALTENREFAVPGSIQKVAAEAGTGITEAIFKNMKLVILGDNSGSMLENDAANNVTREDRAHETVAQLYREYPGQALLIEFSDKTVVRPSGLFSGQHGSTDMAGAIKFLRENGVDQIPGILVVIVSDGLPNSEGLAIEEVKKLRCKVATSYVGPETDQHDSYGDHIHGPAFMRRLANAARNSAGFVQADEVGDIGGVARKLLVADTEKQSNVIHL